MIVIAVLVRDDARFPSWMPVVGVVLGLALVATSLGRLVIVDPTALWPRVSTSLAAILNPIVYLGFAVTLRRTGRHIGPLARAA